MRRQSRAPLPAPRTGSNWRSSITASPATRWSRVASSPASIRATAALALDADGRFVALQIVSVANLGAYLAGSAGGVQTFQYAFLPGTVYAIPAIEMRVAAVFTNTAPIGVLRGPGYGEQNNIIERLIDEAARQTGFDRAELRRRNLVPAAAMPITNAVGNRVDSGAFPETFEKALAAADL